VYPRGVCDVWALAAGSGKVMVWNRKCLKRNTIAEVELENLEELEYYLIENFQIKDKD